MKFKSKVPFAPILLLITLVVWIPQASAQEWTVLDDDEWCDHDWGERYCEVREIALPADRDVIAVDADTNGGIRVQGWNKKHIQLRARVRVFKGSRDSARELASEIEIITDGRKIFARGPDRRRRRGWSVSYQLMVPRESNLSLETLNGGITIDEVHGDIDFEATNGGIRLSRIGGDVRGSTTNGGLSIELDGTGWDGRGLDVSTTNGGVDLRIPKDYSAELITGTVNGGIHVDFPITVRGSIGKRLRTSLGKGGATVRATTTNGGVKIREG
jgi:hypothetical protein